MGEKNLSWGKAEGIKKREKGKTRKLLDRVSYAGGGKGLETEVSKREGRRGKKKVHTGDVLG